MKYVTNKIQTLKYKTIQLTLLIEISKYIYAYIYIYIYTSVQFSRSVVSDSYI